MPASTPPALLGGRQRRARGDEQREEDERDEERRGVDVEHDRRAEGGDQHAGRRGPEQRGGPLRTLEDRVRLRDRALVVADELGQDQPLRGEVGREEARRSANDEHEQHREA